jgi:ATP-dependent Clp protease, protease subunit
VKINIKGPIISNDEQWIYDWFEIEAVSPKKVLDQLEKVTNNEDLVIDINSGGGSVYAASEIYTAIKSHKGKKTANIVGIAASAASVIAMAVDNLLMAPTGQMMIHNAAMRASGDYRYMDHASNFLKNVNQTIANAYSLKSGKSYEDLLAMMDAETWLTPQQALEHNLIDSIMFEEPTMVFASNSDGGLLPKHIIDKVRNELKKLDQFQVTNSLLDNSVPTNQKEEDELNTLDELKNQYPNLFNQAREEGVQAERSRIQAIEDLALPGNEEIINKAKFESGISAEAVAMEVIKAEKKRGQTYLTNAQEDAAQLNNIEGTQAPEANETKLKKEDDEAQALASIVNKKRGIK